ncbi:MAG: hypothetical protein AAGB31_15455 [Bdellovibrio sp.]
MKTKTKNKRARGKEPSVIDSILLDAIIAHDTCMSVPERDYDLAPLSTRECAELKTRLTECNFEFSIKGQILTVNGKSGFETDKEFFSEMQSQDYLAQKIH